MRTKRILALSITSIFFIYGSVLATTMKGPPKPAIAVPKTDPGAKPAETPGQNKKAKKPHQPVAIVKAAETMAQLQKQIEDLKKNIGEGAKSWNISGSIESKHQEVTKACQGLEKDADKASLQQYLITGESNVKAPKEWAYRPIEGKLTLSADQSVGVVELSSPFPTDKGIVVLRADKKSYDLFAAANLKDDKNQNHFARLKGKLSGVDVNTKTAVVSSAEIILQPNIGEEKDPQKICQVAATSIKNVALKLADVVAPAPPASPPSAPATETKPVEPQPSPEDQKKIEDQKKADEQKKIDDQKKADEQKKIEDQKKADEKKKAAGDTAAKKKVQGAAAPAGPKPKTNNGCSSTQSSGLLIGSMLMTILFIRRQISLHRS